MNPKPDHAFQRKRPRFRRNGPSGVAQPGTADHARGTSPADGDDGDDDQSTPDTMEARSLDAEAAYEFAAQHNEIEAPEKKPAEKKQEPAPASNEAPAADAGGEAPPAAETPSQPVDPQTQRREQERMRREQEREKRETERRERERREQERRDQQRREQERRERDRLMELRNLDVDGIVSKAWEIFGAEVKEEGVELFPDNDARELAKRSFRLAEIFLLEESRLRRLRAEPLPGESTEPNNGGQDSQNESTSEAAPE